jgi:hypothetical protein
VSGCWCELPLSLDPAHSASAACRTALVPASHA